MHTQALCKQQITTDYREHLLDEGGQFQVGGAASHGVWSHGEESLRSLIKQTVCMSLKTTLLVSASVHICISEYTQPRVLRTVRGLEVVALCNPDEKHMTNCAKCLPCDPHSTCRSAANHCPHFPRYSSSASALKPITCRTVPQPIIAYLLVPVAGAADAFLKCYRG